MAEIEITCQVKAATYWDGDKRQRKAILVYDGKIEVWIPWSLVTDYSEEKGEITSIFLPDDIAEEKGLI